MRTFVLTDEQEERLQYWRIRHKCLDIPLEQQGEYKHPDALRPVSFTFSPGTMITKIMGVCVCGAEIDLTEWDKA